MMNTSSCRNTYLSLGSNLGDPKTNLLYAISLINQEQDIRIISSSSYYLTSPLEYREQNHFINCVIQIQTDIEPLELLKRMQQIEQKIGNEKPFRYGPRKIDIDIILYGDTILNTHKLQIPHPKMHERRFVLIPLAELNPRARHPV
ncbi:MAG: 2-amino-4-hydroxy-6-hydroxymethyldihydropteridine diphosphokinase, partial [Candidatus Aureabacteria bacterium]|nr:2-amino-4-hydroxy-6-hydroxymethyldihydropteridine diphosphokinase [Candidatus Auribacterota bacterium]